MNKYDRIADVHGADKAPAVARPWEEGDEHRLPSSVAGQGNEDATFADSHMGALDAEDPAMRQAGSDSLSWRQERYRKFSDDFNRWRAAREDAPTPFGSNAGSDAPGIGSRFSDTGSAPWPGGPSLKSK